MVNENYRIIDPCAVAAPRRAPRFVGGDPVRSDRRHRRRLQGYTGLVVRYAWGLVTVWWTDDTTTTVPAFTVHRIGGAQ